MTSTSKKPIELFHLIFSELVARYVCNLTEISHISKVLLIIAKRHKNSLFLDTTSSDRKKVHFLFEN